jgi:hypothetical protein
MHGSGTPYPWWGYGDWWVVPYIYIYYAAQKGKAEVTAHRIDEVLIL